MWQMIRSDWEWHSDRGTSFWSRKTSRNAASELEWLGLEKFIEQSSSSQSQDLTTSNNHLFTFMAKATHFATEVLTVVWE